MFDFVNYENKLVVYLMQWRMQWQLATNTLPLFEQRTAALTLEPLIDKRQ